MVSHNGEVSDLLGRLNGSTLSALLKYYKLLDWTVF